MKRGLVISDLHCGHRVGLTPPKFQYNADNKWGRVQQDLWNAYAGMVDRLKPIDFLFCVGDAIEGKGHRSGGTELLTADRNEQIQMACECLDYAKAPSIIMTYGTGYHVGTDDDWEVSLAKDIGAKKIGGQEWVEVEGVTFDLKHFISSSSIPHGRATPLARARMWNWIWTEDERQPAADVIIRGHVHSFNFAGGTHWLGITLPALQGLGSKFGSRICEGTVDFGVVWFDVEAGKYFWDRDIIVVDSQKAEVIRL